MRLLSKSHVVDVLHSGTEALQRFESGRYDVVLIDLGLPGVPGHRVAQAFRSADSSVAMVLMTGWELHDDDPRKAVFDFCLKKPFDNLNEILDMISRGMDIHHARSRDGS